MTEREDILRLLSYAFNSEAIKLVGDNWDYAELSEDKKTLYFPDGSNLQFEIEGVTIKLWTSEWGGLSIVEP
jgi:hypothetical protein